MRIYVGWRIRILKEGMFTNLIDGSKIVYTTLMRKVYRYTIKTKTGDKFSIRRNDMLEALKNKEIEFYI